MPSVSIKYNNENKYKIITTKYADKVDIERYNKNLRNECWVLTCKSTLTIEQYKKNCELNKLGFNFQRAVQGM